MTAEPQTIPIHPDRLSHGEWKGGKCIGEGDVVGSYSADKISEGQPIRHPFPWSGSLWVAVSITGSGLTVSGDTELQAYRLIPAQLFKGTATTYADKVAKDGGETARNDPNGFYDSIQVRYKGQAFIMSGPSATFIAEIVPNRPGMAAEPETEQLSLF